MGGPGVTGSGRGSKETCDQRGGGLSRGNISVSYVMNQHTSIFNICARYFPSMFLQPTVNVVLLLLFRY